VLGVMGGKARYRAFIADGMKDGHKEEFYDVEDQRFLGAEGFAERLQDQHDEPSDRLHGTYPPNYNEGHHLITGNGTTRYQVGPKDF